MVDGIGDNIGKAIGCLIVFLGIIFFIIGGLSFLAVQQCSKYQIKIEKKSDLSSD